MKVPRQGKLSRRKGNQRHWLNRATNTVVEMVLVVWIIFCLFISLVKFGTYGILLYGSTGKIPSPIVAFIQKSDQWLTQNVWRSN